jgi:hypothetical protein
VSGSTSATSNGRAVPGAARPHFFQDIRGARNSFFFLEEVRSRFVFLGDRGSASVKPIPNTLSSLKYQQRSVSHVSVRYSFGSQSAFYIHAGGATSNSQAGLA